MGPRTNRCMLSVYRRLLIFFFVFKFGMGALAIVLPFFRLKRRFPMGYCITFVRRIHDWVHHRPLFFSIQLPLNNFFFLFLLLPPSFLSNTHSYLLPNSPNPEKKSRMSAISHFLTTLLQNGPKANNAKIVAAVVALLLFKYRSHAVGTRPRRELKQPRGAVPLLGHMPLMLSIPGTKLYDFFVKQNEELGPVWSISLPIIGRMIQGDTPEMVEHVLKTNFWAYEKGPIFYSAMGDLFGNGIFNVDGHEWKMQRRLASHIMNVKAFREYTSDVFVKEGEKVIEYLGKAADAGTVVDFHLLMLQFTLDSFGR